MPKLYVVGVTEDRSGLILAKSPRAKTGDLVLDVDSEVLDALAEVRRFRAEGGARPSVASPALPARRAASSNADSASRLSPREIQARLRRGDSIALVARAAGVDEWRIDAYAAPIAAEQARVIAHVRELVMEKRGQGPSGLPLGDAVQAAVVEKKAALDVRSFESAWAAFEAAPGQWTIRFQYVSRGREQVAEWHYDPNDDAVTPGNRLATNLGWRDPKASRSVPRLPEPGPPSEAKRPKKPAAKKPAAKKPAAKKPAAKKPAAKKPAAKKPAAKKPAAKKPAPKKPAPKKPAATKSAPKKSAAKKPVAKKPKASGSGSPRRAKRPSSAASKRSAGARRTSARSETPPRARASTAAAGAGSPQTASAAAVSSDEPIVERAPLRLVDDPPVDETPRASWREELARRQAEDEGGSRRSWREEIARRLGEANQADGDASPNVAVSVKADRVNREGEPPTTDASPRRRRRPLRRR